MTLAYDAIVYDLDGTLVDLAVDWEAVRADAAEALAARGLDTDGMGLWDLLETATERGHREAVEAVIADHEREGARRSLRLPLAGELPASVPVGVCSLNCEAACRLALSRHELEAHVETVVGRDTVETYKPDPEPLLAAIRGLSAEPARTLFVGDSERDERTASRASVPFQYVAERRSD